MVRRIKDGGRRNCTGLKMFFFLGEVEDYMQIIPTYL